MRNLGPFFPDHHIVRDTHLLSAFTRVHSPDSGTHARYYYASNGAGYMSVMLHDRYQDGAHCQICVDAILNVSRNTHGWRDDKKRVLLRVHGHDECVSYRQLAQMLVANRVADGGLGRALIEVINGLVQPPTHVAKTVSRAYQGIA